MPCPATVTSAVAPREWPHLSPAEAGFSLDIGERLDEAFATPECAGLHGIVVVRDGKLVLERYYEGADERRGEPLGAVSFGPEVLHDLRSATKSIVGLLYGIALAEGKAAGLDRPLVDQFRAYADLVADPERRRMTVYHALTMTLGTAWDEDLPYTDPRNSETIMDREADRYRFVLERPLRTAPGSRWTYNGGATAVLAHLIARGTGRPLLDYAREKLFRPLGISEVEWVAYPDGEPFAASALRMRPRDLAKIGQLVLDSGRWGEAQLVPADWLDQSLVPRVPAQDGLEYGYQWWFGKQKRDDRAWIGAIGNGGQRLLIIPSLRLVVVITAGNYNQPDQWKLPAAVMGQVVMPALWDA